MAVWGEMLLHPLRQHVLSAAMTDHPVVMLQELIHPLSLHLHAVVEVSKPEHIVKLT